MFGLGKKKDPKDPKKRRWDRPPLNLNDTVVKRLEAVADQLEAVTKTLNERVDAIRSENAEDE